MEGKSVKSNYGSRKVKMVKWLMARTVKNGQVKIQVQDEVQDVCCTARRSDLAVVVAVAVAVAVAVVTVAVAASSRQCLFVLAEVLYAEVLLKCPAIQKL
jgi:hypothetical protein